MLCARRPRVTTSKRMEDECVPIRTDAYNNLTSEEVYELLTNAEALYYQLSTEPPVQPKEGCIFLYDLGPDESTWESQKKKLRYIMNSK